MDNIETYKIVLDQASNESSLVYSIALVDDPANQSMFITMAKDKKETLKFENEKRQITGVVLIPNQKIYRFNEKTNKEFYLVFEAEEIRMLSKEFFKNGYQGNSNINHNDAEIINGLTFFESWIVEDPENDKSNALGFANLPKGTWMATAYVEDDAVWEKAKSGEVKGFSIEAFLEFEKIEMSVNRNNNKLNKQEKMGILKRLITMLSADEDIKLQEVESDMGMLTVDSLELGSEVYQDVDGVPTLLVDGSFVFEGNTYKTDAEGKISEITAIEVVEEEVVLEDEVIVEEEVKEEEVILEDEVVAIEEVVSEIVEEVSEEEEIDWDALIKNLTKELDGVLMLNKQLEAEIVTLKAQPATTKLKSNDVSGKETRLERLSRIVNSK